MAPGVVLMLGLAFCLDQRIWAQTAKHKAVDSETKSQGTYDSTSPGMDFPEETQCEVSVDTRPEEDRQMDTQAPTEQGKQEVISAQLHQDSCAENVDPPFSGALEEPPR